jgi:hypothetical protein
MKSVKLICRCDMAVQGNGIKLRQHRNAIDARIDAIADGNINETVLARHWDGRFGAHHRQWEHAGAASAAKNNRQDIVEFGHVGLLVEIDVDYRLFFEMFRSFETINRIG